MSFYPNEPLKTKKILIVDDDHQTRAMLRMILIDKSTCIIEATNGFEALQMVEQELPDLVFMDVNMPGMNGNEACKKIIEKLNEEAPPVIMMTAAEDLSAVDEAFNAGATDFITKPFNWPLLKHRVRYALRAENLSREVRFSRLRESAVRKIAGLGYWEIDLEFMIFRWTGTEGKVNKLSEKFHGEMKFSEFIETVHPEDVKRVTNAFQHLREDRKNIDVEFRLILKSGELILRLVGDKGISDKNHQVFGVLQDLTNIRKKEAMVDYIALHDEITNLPNRRLFIKTLDNKLKKIREDMGKKLLVAWIDLTKFHRQNDSLGEISANKLLNLIGQRLSAPMGSDVTLARVGGDEFALILECSSRAEGLERLNMCLACNEKPYVVSGKETFVTTTTGYVFYPIHGDKAENLLNYAQEAQRHARMQGRTIGTANAISDVALSRKKQMDFEGSLRHALDNKEFFLLYQPQKNYGNNQIEGAEALLRWKHPEQGIITPDKFIPILEENGLINQVGQWVIEESCRQIAKWQEQGHKIRVGINLSPRQFLESDLLSIVKNAQRVTGSSPELIELEITESLAMQDHSHAIKLLSQFRESGFKIAIDDFGIGHSSLEYILKFPLDTIKIDRAFITNVITSKTDRAIVKAVTTIAETMELTVIAEGVENQGQSDLIESLGVSEVQGYLIGRPMTPQDFERLIGPQIITL